MSLYFGNQKISAMTMPNKTVTIDSELSTESENPVQNKVITTALNNKLNADASNLTTDGQKVFDGQWVGRRVRITDGYVTYPQTGQVEFSLADYLPNDNYMYEINISGAIKATTYGKEARIELKTDVFPQVMLCDVMKQSNDANAAPAAGSTIIPVGLGRKIIVNPLSWSVGEYSLWVVGYRRIGTNQ